MALVDTTTQWRSENTVTLLTDDQRAYAVQGAQLTELVQHLYSLTLYDTTTDSTVAVDLDPGGRTKFAEYFFRVPPKVHEFSEPFATTIQPTQGGGKYVESYGSIIKSLRISGTTGLRPNKGAPRSIPVLGVTEDQINTFLGAGLADGVAGRTRGIPASEKTGHDDIIFLRNLFRHYSDAKASNALASKIVMLWRNIKDADYWVVEPEDFRLTQNSSSPLTYEYSISLKTLSRFDFTYGLPPDPLKVARDRARMLARLQEYSQNLLNIFMTIASQVNKITGFVYFASDLVLSPLLNVINGLNAVKTAAFGVVRGIRAQSRKLIDNFDEAIARLVSMPGDLFEDVPRLTVVRNLRRGRCDLEHVLNEPVANESSISADTMSAIDRYASAYDRPGTITTPRRTSDSPTYIGTEEVTESVSTDTVRPGEDLRDIAARLLGDRSHWRVLAVLNKLRSPFISETGGPGVLAPGDAILYPDNSTNASLVGTQNPSNSETAGMSSPVIEAYGRDLRLKSERAGGGEVTDLLLNQRGDLSSIQGVANVEQAINLKFMTQRGELPAHPRYGAKAVIGGKVTASSFSELRINTMSTLSADTRIAEISSIQFVALGDSLAVVPRIKLMNSRDVLDTSFALRRF